MFIKHAKEMRKNVQIPEDKSRFRNSLNKENNMSTHREIVLDTETTGLDHKSGHKIIEIGAVEMLNRVFTGQRWHCYVNPMRDIPDDAYKIHGISSAFLQDKPQFSEVANDFLKFIHGAKLVIHNAAFDVGFLNHELSMLNLPSIDQSMVIDTLLMARKMFPGARNNLDALCKRFKVDNSNRQFHGALKDAELLAKVYVEMNGGRQSSFDMTGNIDRVWSNGTMMNRVSYDDNAFHVIQPTSMEIEIHEKFMTKIL